MLVRTLWRPAAMAVGAVSIIQVASGPGATAGNDPWADEVISYVPGTNAAQGYADPSTALGIPERFTGEGVFPGAVTAFNSAFGVDEIVSVGEGGELVVKFATPVLDDPDNPYGIDLLVFGNALFVFDGNGVGNPAGLFADPGVIEVSADGETWFEVPGVHADDLFPTEGYLDLADPFATSIGSVPSDFTRPVDPALQLDDFAGLTYEQVKALYAGSGGGAGVDLATVGLSEISYVRITSTSGSGISPEIDAFADVAPRRTGDVNYDDAVDVTDLLVLLANWGVPAPGAPPVDLDGDGLVTVTDLLALLASWT